MSRFYEVTRKGAGSGEKVASGMDRNLSDPSPTRVLGAGEKLVPLRQEIPQPAVLLRARPTQPQESKGAEWLRALYIIQKHWRLSALFAAVITATAIVVTYSMKPIYEPVARIEVDPPGEQFSLEGAASGNDAEYLETQAQNLKSDKLAMDVIRRLHLDQSPAMGAVDSGSKTGDLAVYQLTVRRSTARCTRSALT